MRHESFDLARSITIMGAPFTMRSLHPPDARRTESEEHTLDRIMTITLAAIPGLYHHEVATMLVTL